MDKRTSSRVSKITARLLGRIPKSVPDDELLIRVTMEEYNALITVTHGAIYQDVCTVGELRAVVGSAESQARGKSGPVVMKGRKR